MITTGSGAARQSLGMIIRYRDSRVFLLDSSSKRYQSLTLSKLVATAKAEERALLQAVPSDKLPSPPGAAAAPDWRRAPARPKAKVKRLSVTGGILGLASRAYVVSRGTGSERVWFAENLPLPPRRVRQALESLSHAGISGRTDGALAFASWRLPLRVEERAGRSWRTTLRTIRVRRTSLPASAFAPPRAWTRRAVIGSAATATRERPPRTHAANVPANPIRCALILPCGPISSNPRVWVFYWGKTFASPAASAFMGGVNTRLEAIIGDPRAQPWHGWPVGARDPAEFWAPLSYYGVHHGELLGSEVVNEDPPDSVGTWNFFAIDWFVLTHRFGSDAPNYWWRFGGEDPILLIFVDDSEVSHGGWGGYHFFTPTEATLFSLAAHPAMPWIVVRVPTGTWQQRIDTATARAAHEYVEAATDPYPFLSWADPLKQPIWERGEIADICNEGDLAPWGDKTRLAGPDAGTVVNTYWSELTNACVPESRPTVTINGPTDGSILRWKSDIALAGTALDPIDGTLPGSRITWYDGSHELGHGTYLPVGGLALGPHVFTATVVDNAGLSGSASVHATVRADPPSATIETPADGATVASDQDINFRGSAFDPQDGALSGTSLTWEASPPPPGGSALGTGTLLTRRITSPGTYTITLRAVNSAGLAATRSITLHVTGPSGNPSVTILQPADGTNFPNGATAPITFQANANDSAGNPLTGASVVWRDNIDGLLGTGTQISHTLSGGGGSQVFHTVTVTVTDSSGHTATDSITVSSGVVT